MKPAVAFFSSSFFCVFFLRCQLCLQGFDALGISLVPIVTKLREQRHPWAVEGFEQYQFAYQLLAHLVAGMKEPPLFETGAG